LSREADSRTRRSLDDFRSAEFRRIQRPPGFRPNSVGAADAANGRGYTV